MNVQSLQTMKSLSTVDETVSVTLDKLPAIRGYLLRDNKDWENWNFLKLTEVLKFWMRRNTVKRTPGKKTKGSHQSNADQTERIHVLPSVIT